jgi:hypothetical protein
MSIRVNPFFHFAVVVLFACLVLCGGVTSIAQNSGISLAMHANSKVSAADIGLPAYPGATPFKDKDNDSAVDLGFSFGSFHFSVVAANYVTSDTPAQVLAFYRKSLAHYGEVLECDHGKPVGAVAVTGSGLTCSDDHHGNGNGSSSTTNELRAGVPNKYRLVGIDKSQQGSTRFALVYLDLPQDSGKGKSSK